MRITRKLRGVTLLELLLAIVLLTAVAATATASFLSIKSLKRNFLDRDAAFVRANLATATIFERTLRSGAIGVLRAFEVHDSGKTVILRRTRRGTPGVLTERIWFDPVTGEVKYRLGTNPERVLLRGVVKLLFTNDSGRLALDMTLGDGQKIRTAVQPRNQRTPASVIN